MFAGLVGHGILTYFVLGTAGRNIARLFSAPQQDAGVCNRSYQWEVGSYNEIIEKAAL
jgi:hypothetical protein